MTNTKSNRILFRTCYDHAMRASPLLITCCLACGIALAAEKPLEIFFIDVEGGQATLLVPPHGSSLLIDTGWGYQAFRDAIRISDMAKKAHVKKIDAVVITHYHSDHVGGVPQLLQKMDVGQFFDHGPNREDSKTTRTLYSEYQQAIAGHAHTSVKPGDRLPLKGLDAVVVSADGQSLAAPLPDAGQSNDACRDVQPKRVDDSENARSVGLVVTYGSFRFVDLGDLTWNKELELVCPNNKLGKADVFLVSHHGLDQSNSPALVRALAPRAAIMDNSSKKGGSPMAVDIVRASPGLEDLWQLHFADEGGSAHNVNDPMIANVNEGDTGFYLKLSAYENGNFEIYNPRNKLFKKYGAQVSSGH